MGVKETPVSIRSYYKLFIDDNKEKLKNILISKQELITEIEERHKDIETSKEIYLKEFNFDVDKYEEFVDNKYSTGRFLKAAKGLLINKENDYELISDCFDLYELAFKQKELDNCNNNIEFYKKCINIKLKEYTEYLRAYYTEVHKQLILEGKGYSFSNNIGWICINRCIFDRKKPMLDYAATKKREAQLKAEGKRIYNKEEADWCLRNGIEYKAEDKRVFICSEYCYQIPLIDCKLTNGGSLKLEITDYRHRELRGKSNEKLIEECKGNTTKICELSLDLKTKLTLCDKADKILYTKFIRNEAQKPIAYSKANRKN